MYIWGNQVESVKRMKVVRQPEMGAYLVSCKNSKKKKKKKRRRTEGKDKDEQKIKPEMYSLRNQFCYGENIHTYTHMQF